MIAVLGGFLHWSQDAKETSSSLSVEIGSYVLLAKLSASPTNEDLGYSARIVRWLTGQQNYYGGFSSTQVFAEFNIQGQMFAVVFIQNFSARNLIRWQLITESNEAQRFISHFTFHRKDHCKFDENIFALDKCTKGKQLLI